MNKRELDLIVQSITKIEETLRILKQSISDADTDKRVIYEIMKYRSKSGNETWKCFCEDGQTVYLRQSMRDFLIENGVWEWLNSLDEDSTYACHIEIETVPDGNFHKVVEIQASKDM